MCGFREKEESCERLSIATTSSIFKNIQERPVKNKHSKKNRPQSKHHFHRSLTKRLKRTAVA